MKSMPRDLEEQKVVWNTMKTMYKLLASYEAQKIIQILLQKREIHSTELMTQADLTESQFHPIMRQLVKYLIIERTVNQDRTVSYKISDFGKNVLELSQPLLQKIRQVLPEDQLIAN
jgi:predicted transcriptional regulator